MRKYIILLFALSFFSIHAYNQNVFVPETNLGIKVGGILSTVDFKPSVQQELNFGFTGGIVFKHISQKSLGVQLELNYMQAGWSEKLDTTNTYSRRLDYIQIPFMTHVNFGNGKTRFVLNLGPSFSFLVSEKESLNLISEEEEKEYYNINIDNRLGFGLCLGLGISRQTSIGLFQLEGRINQSLTNIFSSGSDSMFEYSRSQTVEVALYYLLDYKNIKKTVSSIFHH